MPLTSEHLFVYGTLRRSFQNETAALLRESGEFLGEGRVRGRLYRVAWYPGLVLLSNGDEWVRGDVFRFDNCTEVYRLLDAYEGCGPRDPEPHAYRRVAATVLLDTGEWIQANVYEYAQQVDERERIAEWSGRDLLE